MLKKKVALSPITDKSSKVYCRCSFCSKECRMESDQFEFYKRLSPEGKFLCCFCLRNEFHLKIQNNILIMSFRGIIGQLYYSHYKQRKIWISQIKDLFEKQREIGLKNPVFSYDPETLLWFIDFSKVGSSPLKVSLEEVVGTIKDMVYSLELSEYFNGYNNRKLHSKFKQAIEKFYSCRYRPTERRALIPTLDGCAVIHQLNKEKVRNFTLNDIDIKR